MSVCSVCLDFFFRNAYTIGVDMCVCLLTINSFDRLCQQLVFFICQPFQMKLNKDCVREVLIYLEEHLGYNDHLDASTIQIDPYTSEEILYTISLLSEAGYIKAVSVADLCTTPTYFVESILMPGHDLLDNIRDDNVWRKTKKIASKFASASLNVLSSVATSVLSSMLLNPPTV